MYTHCIYIHAIYLFIHSIKLKKFPDRRISHQYWDKLNFGYFYSIKWPTKMVYKNEYVSETYYSAVALKSHSPYHIFA